MKYVKSKQRVADHGEVFTPAWMVEAMLDLVKEYATETYKHLKPLGLSADALPLLEQEKQQAPGVVDIGKDLDQFIKDLNAHKVWARDAFMKKAPKAKK